MTKFKNFNISKFAYKLHVVKSFTSKLAAQSLKCKVPMVIDKIGCVADHITTFDITINRHNAIFIWQNSAYFERLQLTVNIKTA